VTPISATPRHIKTEERSTLSDVLNHKLACKHDMELLLEVTCVFIIDVCKRRVMFS
jgi:hypothetical protein